MPKFIDWCEKHKYWIALGLVVLPTSGYFSYRIYQQRLKSKSGQFSQLISSIKSAIYTSNKQMENIVPLQKVTSFKMKNSGQGDLPFEVHLLENLSRKENISKDTSSFKKEDPFLPPFEKGIFIKEFDENRLIFNKFPLIKHHVLLISKGFEEQQTAIPKSMFHEGYLVLRALNGVSIYNSGPESGYSQPHRHLQFTPPPREFGQPMISLINKEARECVKREENSFEFSGFEGLKHLVACLEPFDPENQTREEYSDYLNERYLFLLESLGNSDTRISYNFIWNDKWMMVVLRSQENAFDRFGTNAFGFIGSLVVKSSSDLEDLSELEPTQFLRQVCVLKEDNI